MHARPATLSLPLVARRTLPASWAESPAGALREAEPRIRYLDVGRAQGSPTGGRGSLGEPFTVRSTLRAVTNPSLSTGTAFIGSPCADLG
jgi:hypothetical protein